MSLPAYAEAQMPIRRFFEQRYGVHGRAEYDRAKSRPGAGTWAALHDMTGANPDVAASPRIKRSVGANPYQPWIDYQVNVLKRRGSDDEFRAWISGRVAKMNASNALVKAGAMTPFSLKEPVKPLALSKVAAVPSVFNRALNSRKEPTMKKFTLKVAIASALAFGALVLDGCNASSTAITAAVCQDAATLQASNVKLNANQTLALNGMISTCASTAGGTVFNNATDALAIIQLAIQLQASGLLSNVHITAEAPAEQRVLERIKLHWERLGQGR